MNQFYPFKKLFLFGSLLLFAGALQAQITTTVTKCYTGPTVTVDATGDYGSTLPSVTFTTADFLAGTTVADVDIEIEFNKTDGTCASPGTGSSFHGETSFRINGPTTLQEVLAMSGTWSGNVSTSNVTVTFDQSAASIPSVTPVTGSFLPNNGDLNSYNGTNPLGDWFLEAGDNAGGDPLCVIGYCVTVTGNQPCVGATPSIIDSGNALCYGDTSGFAVSTATGGTMPYTYLWSNGATTATATGLSAGVYSVTITDATGCGTETSVTIEEPDSLATSLTKNDVLCFGELTGAANVVVTGGTQPYTYSWNSGGTAAAEMNIGSGFAAVSVVDDNGCTISDSILITEPAELVLTINNIVDVTCENGSDGQIQSSAAGGVIPYFFQYDDPAMQVSQTAVNLEASTYSVVVTDNNGCVQNDVAQVGFTNPAPTVDLGPDVNANAPFYDIVGPTTAGLTYLWSTGANSSQIRVFSSGTYTLTVTDALGCPGTDEILVSGIWPTGIDDQEANQLDVDIFPNPVKEDLQIVLNGMSNSSVNIQVLNVLGQIVSNHAVTPSTSQQQETLNLSALPAGPYVVRIATEEKTAAFRVLVE